MVQQVLCLFCMIVFVILFLSKSLSLLNSFLSFTFAEIDWSETSFSFGYICIKRKVYNIVYSHQEVSFSSSIKKWIWIEILVGIDVHNKKREQILLEISCSWKKKFYFQRYKKSFYRKFVSSCFRWLWEVRKLLRRLAKNLIPLSMEEKPMWIWQSWVLNLGLTHCKVISASYFCWKN